MGPSHDDLQMLKAGFEEILDKVELSKHVAVTVISSPPSEPSTTLMHVRFSENQANVEKLAQFLWNCAQNYALSRRRRRELRQQMLEAPADDLSVAALISTAVREAFLEFNKAYPHRASEVGELLAYCIAVEHLGASQLAAKMALKTNSNMPVHGLDGIHGKVENGWLTIFFLESKLSASANEGAKAFAESVAEFSNNRKQFRREYQIVRDLGNLDSLSETDRKLALDYFDVLSSSDTPLRERYIGVVLYSDPAAFKSLPPVKDDQAPGFHEQLFAAAYKKELEHHQLATMRHLTSNEAEVGKCKIFYVVVPDKDVLREQFYHFMGYMPPKETA